MLRYIPENPVARSLTRYAHSGDASIAYQVLGSGSDRPGRRQRAGVASGVMWEEPNTARCFERLASFSRVVLFDRRGTGLSDPVTRPPTLEQQMDDLLAVLDAAGIERTALLGRNRPRSVGAVRRHLPRSGDGAGPVLGLAARCRRRSNPELRAQFLDAIENHWGDGTLMSLYAPSQVGNRAFEEWWGRMQRSAVSPGMAGS